MTSPNPLTGTTYEVGRRVAAMAPINRRARETNLARTRQIEAVLATLHAGDEVSQDDLRTAERAAHKVAGSAGVFAMHRASDLARELEAILGRRPLAGDDLQRATKTLGELRTAIAEEPATFDHEERGEICSEILVAYPDRGLAERITAAAARRGWSTRWAADTRSAREAILTHAPDVVLLGLDLPVDGATALLDVAAGERPPCPTLVVSDHDGFVDRVEAARAGADGFLASDLDADVVVAVAIEAAGRRVGERMRVLAVDADESILEALAETYRDTGFELSTLAEPNAFWEVLDAVEPDLVLLGANQGAPGLDLCRSIRSDMRWATLPVLVLLHGVSPEAVAAVFAAGADDYVSTPVVGAEVLTRTGNRLDRARLERRIAQTDMLTGVANRQAFTAAFTRLTAQAAQSGEPLSLALIDMDKFRHLNEVHGHGMGDVVLKRLAAFLSETFHRADLVGRWGGQEFVVAMDGTRRSDGVARVAAALETFRNESFTSPSGRQVRASFSGAVAEFGPDGRSVESLVRASTPAMGAAKRAGGNRVLPAGWRPRSGANVTDVYIVEDDETLSGLLQQALSTRGLRSEREADGRLALERLVGPNPLTARVILLDVDLPGMNGLDVLRGIEEAGVLGRSKVIMLTVLSDAADVQTALRHGAFDHVAKPFSLPVLMQRLRRALEATR